MHRRDALKWVALVGAAAVTATSNAGGDSNRNPETNTATVKGGNQVSNVNELVARYIAAWNERDSKHRHDLVARTWANSGTYVDSHRHGEGHDGIDEMIETAQRKFPAYQLRLVSKIETHNNYVRFSWAAWVGGDSEQAPLYVAGTDFGVISGDGRFQTVTGFVDAAPAPTATQ
jgi:SnoaL-like domain